MLQLSDNSVTVRHQLGRITVMQEQPVLEARDRQTDKDLLLLSQTERRRNLSASRMAMDLSIKHHPSLIVRCGRKRPASKFKLLVPAQYSISHDPHRVCMLAVRNVDRRGFQTQATSHRFQITKLRRFPFNYD